ncbi:Putative vacuolar membrane transporter for cationic amino acids [Rhodotorula toruloides]
MAVQELTLRMIVSSLFGWLALSTTCAAFVPVVVMNAARMRVSSSPGFLWTWLFGDITNLLGAVLGKLPPTQLALAIWYTAVDVTMIIQLRFFGHLDPLAPDPKPTKVFVKLQERKKKHPRWYKITVAFMSFSAWDDIKLLLFCIAAGLAAGGIYLTLGLHNDPEHFVIEEPRVLDPKSLAFGIVSAATFCIARFPEMRSGENRSKAGIKPQHELDDPLFYFLIAENFFNIVSILILSTNGQYLLIQSPWLGGSALSIVLDGVLIWRIAAWQKRWNERKGADGETGAARDTERAARLAKLDEEKAQLEEEWEVEDMHVEAHAPVPTQRDGESKTDYKRRVHAHAVARKDYLENQHLVADIKARGDHRAGRHSKREKDDEKDDYASGGPQDSDSQNFDTFGSSTHHRGRFSNGRDLSRVESDGGDSALGHLPLLLSSNGGGGRKRRSVGSVKRV